MSNTAITATAVPTYDNVLSSNTSTVINKVKQAPKVTTSPENEQNRQQPLAAGDVYKSVLRDYPDVLNVDQVGTILGVSTKTVYRLLNEGSLTSLKVGRAFKIPKLYVLQYIKVLALN